MGVHGMLQEGVDGVACDMGANGERLRLTYINETFKRHRAARPDAGAVDRGSTHVRRRLQGRAVLTMQTTNYKNVRDIILKKKKSTPADDLFIIIKPDKDATYKDAVDILDEMDINDISRYAMVDPTPDEYSKIQQTEQASGIK